MGILDYLAQAVALDASDLHITAGKPPILRLDGALVPIGDAILRQADAVEIAKQVLSEEQFQKFDEIGEYDFSYGIPNVGRFRVNVYKQRGSYSFAFRVVRSKIPTMEKLGLPPIVSDLARKQRGMVLVTGPTGSGKSTTLASMVDLINAERSCHIITLEDPIEYLHQHNKSVIGQREIGSDTQSFTNGLRAALREDPDVILVGEMRDLDTISIALTAAETGHLVLSTLHTIGAADTVNRIIDIFPAHQQQQIRVQLSTVLNGIISQQLLAKKSEKGRVGAFEVLVATNAIRNMVREGKTVQIPSAIQTGAKFGMQSMDNALLSLYRAGTITKDSTLTYSFDYDYVRSQV